MVGATSNTAQATGAIDYTSLLIFAVIVLSIGGIMSFYVYKMGKTPKAMRKLKSQERMVKVYILLENFPLTTRRVRKISGKLVSLSVLDIREIYKMTAELFIKGAAITAALALAGLLMFDDVVSMVMCICLGFIGSNVFLDKKVDSITTKVYESLRITLSSMREEFLRLGSVEEALSECEADNLMKGIIDGILSIITSSNSELKMKEFFERVPFRPIQTLAMMCYRTSNIGDEETNGESNFMRALKYLSEDINSEISKRDYQKHIFGKIEYLCLAPIPAIKLIEMFFANVIPGLTVVYKGTLGYIIKISILLVCIVSFTIIATINNSTPIKEDDRNETVNELLRIRVFRRFINDIKCKNHKHRKLKAKLDKALSKKSVTEFYALKFLYAVGVFFGVIITTMLVVQIGRDFMETNTQPLSMMASNDTKDIEPERLLEMDNTYIKMRDEGKNLTLVNGVEFCRGWLPELNDLQLQDQLDRLTKKYNSLKGAYFKWYFVILAYLCAILGWFIPNFILKGRTGLVENEAQEDFLQIQTLMTIISATGCDNLDALEQMCQVSKIHKGILLYCYNSYPSNPELELARLESKTPLTEFKRFVQKMKVAISDLSLKESFSDLEVERQYILNKRENTIRSAIESRRGTCGLISRFPMVFLIGGMLLAPIVIVGVQELMKAMNSLGNM